MYDYDYKMLASKGAEWAKNNFNILNNGSQKTIPCTKRSFDPSVHSITTQVKYKSLYTINI